MRRRKPSRAQRYAKAARVPAGAVVAYRLQARKISAEFKRRLERAVFGRLADFALEQTRKDAAEDDSLGSLLPSTTTIRAASAGVAEKVIRHSKTEFRRIGITLDDEPSLTRVVAGWRKDTASRFARILEKEREHIAELLGDSEHRTPDELQDRLEERCVVVQSKLETAAHDDILTLNGQITRERQTAAGIEQFIWTTAGEERVRESHAAIDGNVYDWDDPPEVDGEVSVPGEPPNCRCVAFPVLPELQDEEAA